jgi:hypothetical protein
MFQILREITLRTSGLLITKLIPIERANTFFLDSTTLSVARKELYNRADRFFNSRSIREYNFMKYSEIVPPDAIELTAFTYDYNAVQKCSLETIGKSCILKDMLIL